MNLLTISDLKTHFPTPDGIVKAVDTVDLTISEKETPGLIGETDCGETVPGLSIVRLLQPTTTAEGKITSKISVNQRLENNWKMGQCRSFRYPFSNFCIWFSTD
jgi:ABC-type dipeptide/oligopeptide/nickel transport system ATPase component